MTVDKMFIKNLREKQRICISEEMETFLLTEYGEEPFPYVYTEQDLHEQIYKLINQYQAGTLNASVKSPVERLQKDYSYLQQNYANATAIIKKLESDISVLKNLLYRNNIKILDSVEELPF